MSSSPATASAAPPATAAADASALASAALASAASAAPSPAMRAAAGAAGAELAAPRGCERPAGETAEGLAAHRARVRAEFAEWRAPLRAGEALRAALAALDAGAAATPGAALLEAPDFFLVVGGLDAATGEPVARALRVDKATGARITHELPVPMAHAAACWLSRNVVAVSGGTRSRALLHASAEVWTLSLTRMAWTPLAPMREPRMCHALAAAYDARAELPVLVACGGYADPETYALLRSAELLPFPYAAWEALPPMLAARAQHALEPCAPTAAPAGPAAAYEGGALRTRGGATPGSAFAGAALAYETLSLPAREWAPFAPDADAEMGERYRAACAAQAEAREAARAAAAREAAPYHSLFEARLGRLIDLADAHRRPPAAPAGPTPLEEVLAAMREKKLARATAAPAATAAAPAAQTS